MLENFKNDCRCWLEGDASKDFGLESRMPL